MNESKPELERLTSFIKDAFDAEETMKIEGLATDDPIGTASLFKFGLSESAAARKRAETITKFYRSESPINGEYRNPPNLTATRLNRRVDDDRWQELSERLALTA